ncbi:hypothetical protein C8A05DRAFT_46007 [Staphylotrichum tortipilum]|uniref:Uncharacterized protein n=1 Tax=Staphylotrichum tortipilum TaxID=2831512 RepID=A0AAN6MFW1_9PEZI|nr:hypothetical protein C8A05DRAFT_46007 [Staphylotrichum longicolle]
MDPEVGLSLARTITSSNADRWAASGVDSVPADAIAHWYDDDSTILFPCKRPADEPLDGDFTIDRVYLVGTGSGVCSRANNIRFVTKIPGVPIRHVIHTWIDRDLPSNRTFLLTKRVPGEFLEVALPRVSDAQRDSIADYVADVCVTLAETTSPRFETTTGCAVYEPWLTDDAPQSHPTWKLRLLGHFSSEALYAYMIKISAKPAPLIDPELECRTDKPGLWGQLLADALEKRGGYIAYQEEFRVWNRNRVED